MYWSTTCKVETAESKRPACGVPSPTSDGIVDESTPDEDEYKEGTKTTAFCDSTNGESRTVLCMVEKGDLKRRKKKRFNIRDGCEH